VQVVLPVEVLKPVLQFLECIRMIILAGDVGQSTRKFLAFLFPQGGGIGELLHRIDRRLSERLVGHGRARITDDRKPPRQAVLCGQAV